MPLRRTLTLILGAAALSFVVWQHVEATRVGYEVESRRETVRRLRNGNLERRLAVERASSPAEIAGLARSRLRMVPGAPEAVKVLGRRDPSAGPSGEASGAPRRLWTAIVATSPLRDALALQSHWKARRHARRRPT